MKIATLKLDVTPPVGTLLAYGTNQETDTPIYIRGIIFDNGGERSGLFVCDFIYIWGQAWLDWRERIATAIGALPEHVFLHCVHQHDSMRIAWKTEETAELAVDFDYCLATLNKLEDALREVMKKTWQPVTKLKTAECRMSRLASNRRLLDKDGKCFAMRFSMCNDSELRALPVGQIDPLLRTLAFCDAKDHPLVALHFYASHPMAAYLRDKASSDVPGVALAYTERQFGTGTFNLYFTGCAANVTFGKYFTGDKEESLHLLGERLGAGMVANLERLSEVAFAAPEIAKASFEFPFRNYRNETHKAMTAAQKTIHNNLQQWKQGAVYQMRFGDAVRILSFPSEIAVEYQLYAQSLVPEYFVACAAYGNGLYHYIPTAKMFKEGGYEPGVSLVTPEIEERLETAIKTLLTH